MARTWHWLIRFAGREPISSDDLTLEEVELVEGAAGTPWAALDPWARLKDAKAFVLVAAMRAGDTEAEAKARLKSLKLKDIRGVFTPEFDETPLQPGGGDVSADPPPSAPSSPAG